MEDDKKKILMIAVIVVCLGGAAAVLYMKGFADRSDLGQFEGELIWLKCAAEDCGNTWQMDKKKYFEFVEANMDPLTLLSPPVTCPKCGAESGYRAFKCEQCGEISFLGVVRNDYEDRCPKCGYSSEQERRKSKSAPGS